MKKCKGSYKGMCCCNCMHQLEISVCRCGKCSTVEGWICIGFLTEPSGDRIAIHHTKEHGMCELHKLIKGVKHKTVKVDINDICEKLSQISAI